MAPVDEGPAMARSDDLDGMVIVMWSVCERCGALGPRMRRSRCAWEFRAQCCGVITPRLSKGGWTEAEQEFVSSDVVEGDDRSLVGEGSARMGEWLPRRVEA